MDKKRLATILFDSGKKITQKEIAKIQESITEDSFSLNEQVVAYKEHDSFFNKCFFLLEDGTKILISGDSIRQLNTLNIDRTKLESFMMLNEENFKSALRIILDGNQ